MKHKMIPLSVPSIKGKELFYLKECIKTEYVSSVGKHVNLFEKKICKFTGSKYAVSCTNGTASLHLALRIMGVEEDDEIIVPTMTFVATVNAIKYLKANPIFMDCDNYFNIDVNKVVSFIKENTFFKNNYSYNKKTKKRIPVLIVVHVFGNAVNLIPLIEICKKRNIKIVEDAAGALGTFYLVGKLKSMHAGTVGDVGCLSFNGNKIITSGGGGMILTRDKKIAQRALYLSTQASDNSTRYIHNDIGYNYRLTNIQAAVGLAQLEMINIFLRKKNKIYNYYKNELNKINGVYFNNKPKYAKNNKWMMSIQIDENTISLKKDKFIELLSKQNIETRSIWLPAHQQKSYLNYQAYKIKNAEQIYRKTLCIPASSNLTLKQADLVVNAIKKSLD